MIIFFFWFCFVLVSILTHVGTIPDSVVAVIPQVLESVLQLIELCPNDDMVSTLESIIDKFPAAIAPSAGKKKNCNS